MLDLAQRHLEQVKAILARRVPLCEVRAFGSRVSGQAKPWSDLDLAVMTTSRLPFEVLAALRYDFEESDLPFPVDVVDYSSVSPQLRRVIARSSTLIYAPGCDELASSSTASGLSTRARRPGGPSSSA